MKQNRRAIVEGMTVGQMQDFVDVSFTITGAKGLVELYDMLESRFNSTDDTKLEAIPLGDWCKDNNFSRPRLFKELTNLGYIDKHNRITPLYIKEVHQPDPEEAEDIVAFSELVLFNSKKVNQTYTLMIRPNAVEYNTLVAKLSNVTHTYIGSKGLSPKKLQNANAPVKTLVDWRG